MKMGRVKWEVRRRRKVEGKKEGRGDGRRDGEMEEEKGEMNDEEGVTGSSRRTRERWRKTGG